MKKMRLIPVVLLILAMAACSKEGPPGPAGQDGNINVLYSDWFICGSWTGGGTPKAYCNRSAPEITQGIIDSGVVLAYTRLIGDGLNARILPAISNTGDYAEIWNYILSAGNIQFTCQNVSTNMVYPSSSVQFRYIIFPGGTHLRLRQPIEQLPYEEVCRLLGIQP